jgi:hypothetical protein
MSSNEVYNEEPQDAVPMPDGMPVKKLGVPERVKVVLNYLDGRKVNGEVVTLDAIKLDHRVLKTIRLKRIHRENQLANYLGMRMADEWFQESLARLASFGLITRTNKRWDYTGAWVEIADEDKQVNTTARGVAVEYTYQGVK